MTLYSRLRPLAFTLPPETAHTLGKGALRVAGATGPTRALLESRYRYEHPALTIDRFGTTFRTPVGVAAGFDKNAQITAGLAALGFGFVEVGTVTPAPQEGNERPRLFRLPEDEALINRMGFNGHGAERVRDRLERAQPTVPIGVNVGKMNDSGETQAIEDYREVFDQLAPFAEYVVINVSCPNTPDEFDEADPDHLRAIFTMLERENDHGTPILVKIGPDVTERSILDLLEVVDAHDIAGIVATNTSTQRSGLSSPTREEWGGLSGKPLEASSTSVIETVATHTDLPIIGVGGIDSAESAYAKIKAGASLLQLYTAFVYHGPSIARQINRGLVEALERDGFSSIEEAIGADLDAETHC